MRLSILGFDWAQILSTNKFLVLYYHKISIMSNLFIKFTPIALKICQLSNLGT